MSHKHLKYYELSFITTPEISENESEKIIEELRELISKHGGLDVHYEPWGTRTSNYPIKKRTKLNYHCLFFKDGNVNAITNALEYKSNILRFMCVKAKDKMYSELEASPLAQSLVNKTEAAENQNASGTSSYAAPQASY